MRFVKGVGSEEEAKGFVDVLSQNGIDATVEVKDGTFEIWVLSEDHFEQAEALFATATPAPRLKKPRIIAQQSIAGERWIVTKLLIILCVALFLFQSMQMRNRDGAAQRMGLSPIMLTMLYDYPLAFEKLYTYLENHPEVKIADPTQAVRGAYWEGIYDIALYYPDTDKAPLFEKIRQGEVYRTITPSLLHGGILHILFNMLWLWLLGKQVEHRIGIVRYLALSLCIGVISNTAQYLMSGFLFLGYSGIVAGLAGFIWVRQKKAPWEGYPLSRATLIFLAIFILGMSILSIMAFLFAKFQIMRFPTVLANTGHIVGALCGILFARLPIFVRRRM